MLLDGARSLLDCLISLISGCWSLRDYSLLSSFVIGEGSKYELVNKSRLFSRAHDTVVIGSRLGSWMYHSHLRGGCALSLTTINAAIKVATTLHFLYGALNYIRLEAYSSCPRQMHPSPTTSQWESLKVPQAGS
jgi:hypothetical protein